jgi:hypothetical protein
MFRSFVALVACAAVAAPAAADDTFVRLVNVDSGKVLAVKDDSGEAGATAVLAKPDEANKAQQWKLEKDGKTHKLVNRKSGLVLDVNEDSKEEGASIIVWDAKAEDADNQRWLWEGEGKERRLKSKSSDMVLDIDDEGRIIQKKGDEKSKKQLWRVEDVK